MPELAFKLICVIGHQLDNVDAIGRAAGIIREEPRNARPDNILLGEPQHLLVDGFNRGNLQRDQRAGMFQRRVETVVADIDQQRMRRDRQKIDLDLRDHGQRAFRSAQNGVEVEATILAPQMLQIIARHIAVEIGENLVDQRPLLGRDAFDGAIDLTDSTGLRLSLRQRRSVERAGPQFLAIGQDDMQPQNVIAGLAIKARPLPACIGADHAANGGAVGGGKLRCENRP